MQPTWTEHLDLIQWIIGALFLSLVWFIVRTLKKIDANQNMLFEKYGDVHERLSHLEGAHDARTGMKLSCKVEK